MKGGLDSATKNSDLIPPSLKNETSRYSQKPMMTAGALAE